MLIFSVQELRAEIDIQTGDKYKTLLPQEDFLILFNQAQRYFCEKTHVLKKRGFLTVSTGSHTYLKPDDCISIYKVVLPNGEELVKISLNDIRNRHQWRQEKNINLEYWFDDFGGRDDIGFFPLLSVDDYILSTVSQENDGSNDATTTNTNEINENVIRQVRDNITNSILTVNNALGKAVNVVNATDKLFLEYSAFPRKDVVEIEAREFLKYDILSKIYERQGVIQSLRQSRYFKNEAMKEMKRYKTLVNDGYGENKKQVRGDFF